ncbi:MAG: OmpA family protein [Cyclobacteriaceae bacterium]|nr:OmpA family protein [Cyclobacteriaceae bacterium]
MRKSTYTLFLLILLAATTKVSAQTAESNYYVVIGVFGRLDYTIRMTNKANQNGFNAQYAINPRQKWNYVYLLQTTDKRKAYAFTIRMRAETEYKDAWVFKGQLGDPQGQTVEEKPVIEEKPVEKPIVLTDPVKKDSVVEEKPIVDEKPVVEEKPVVKPKPPGKPFLFKFESKDSDTPIVGEVHIQESNNATRYQAFKANEIVYIEAPKNSRGNYVIVTQAAGFQPVSLILSYQEPSPEVGPEGEAVIPIELGRVKRGDYIDFTNVRFFRNSSILDPAAQNELDGLVDLMKESPGYKIRVHGHCNGTQDKEGSILGSSTNFFALDPTKNKIGKFSAKELTNERAATVKAYLVSQGIESSRIDTKGEGGKIPLYPNSGTLGQYNDRVEIEITKRG